MAKPRRFPFRSVVAVLALLIAIVFFGPLDLSLRYISFLSLTKEKLVSEAEAYIDDRAGGNQMACVYVVKCDERYARLDLVRDIRDLDLKSVKRDIWDRRTRDICRGRTTNIALHLIPKPGHEEQIDALARSRWSFINDRFIPLHGRFQSGSFTDQPWERCTPERAIIRNADPSGRVPTPQNPPPASAGR